MESLRILIVDDHAVTRSGLRWLLEARPGWRVVGEAADGAEGVEKARELRPDVVLMDISMPRMDGVEASRKIRRQVPEAVVIVVSQNEAPVVEWQAKEAQAHAYVLKGRLAQDLVPTIEVAVQQRDTGRGTERREAGGEIHGMKTGQIRDKNARSEVGDRVMDELESLRKASKREGNYLAAIVDSSDDAIVSKDLNGVITSWNASAERMFGYTAEEAVGKHITLIIPKDRHAEEARIIEQIRRGERLEHFETVRMRKDGSLLDLSLTISPVKDAEGTIIGASKIAREITERKRAQEALAKRAKQHRALYQLASRLQTANTHEQILDAALEAICDALKCDRASILLYDDSSVMRFVRWRGLSEEYRNATEGHSPWKAGDADAIPILMEDVSAAELEAELKATIEREGIRALAFVPLIDDEKVIGKFMMYFDERHAFTEDETELSLTIARQLASAIDRKRAEVALRHSEERQRRLAESLDAEVKARTAELVDRNVDVLRQSEQLRELSWRMMQIQDEERRHMARELHDSAGQMLAVLAMNLGTAQRRAAQISPELAEKVAECEQVVQHLDQEIRTMSYLLHPPLLDESGLCPALNWYVQGLSARSGMEIKMNVDEELGRLPNDMELLIFRIVQEGLTNIHRHSESKIARIAIGLDAEGVAVEVEDHGKGIAPEKLAEIQGRGSGVGLRGMRERVRQFQGEMRIESNGSGTRICVRLPYESETAPACEEISDPEEAAPAKDETVEGKAFVQRQSAV